MKSTVDRREKIMNIIQTEGSAKVEELSEKCDVSTVTIRNDLEFFEEKGLIHRIYGGALLRNNVYSDPSLEEKQKLNIDEKRRIGKAAAEMINGGESIIFDSGTTTRQIALQLKDKDDLTVMTNGINTALELATRSELQVMLTGGILREKSRSLVGPEAEQTMNNYYFDKLFLGVDGIDFERGLTTSNSLEAQLNRSMVKRANQVIAVTDATKFGRHSFSRICGLEEIDTIITDDNISDEFEHKLNNHTIKVITVSVEE